MKLGEKTFLIGFRTFHHLIKSPLTQPEVLSLDVTLLIRSKINYTCDLQGFCSKEVTYQIYVVIAFLSKYNVILEKFISKFTISKNIKIQIAHHLIKRFSIEYPHLYEFPDLENDTLFNLLQYHQLI